MQERQMMMEETKVSRQVSVQGSQTRKTEALGDCALAIIVPNIVQDDVALIVVEYLGSFLRWFSIAGLG